MPFFSISCVRIETAAGSCLCPRYCCLLRFLHCLCCCLRGWLCGIPEWNNSQSESHNMAARPTPKAERRCHLFALPHFFASSANCFFFISSSSSSRRGWGGVAAQAAAAGASAASSGPPLPRECHSNSLLRFIFPLPARQAGRRQIACGMSTTGVGGSGKSGLGVGVGFGVLGYGGCECKSTAIVARVCARK